MYWTVKMLPELKPYPPLARLNLLEAAGVPWQPRHILRPSLIAGFLFLISTQLIYGQIELHLIGRTVPLMHSGRRPLIDLSIWMASSFGCYLLLLRRCRARFIGYLHELQGSGNQLPACIQCGYLLKGITSQQCPECGAVIR